MVGAASGNQVVSRGDVCPLCGGSDTSLYHVATTSVPWHLYSPTSSRDKGLCFFSCATCLLVFKDPSIRATAEQETRRYEKHHNDLADNGYREHLMTVVRPLMELVPPTAVGLDYGCGPCVSTEVLVRELERTCSSYDPNFFPREELLREGSYDFITCTEVAEHFKSPRREFEKVRELLKPGGVLGLMTQLVPERFEDWWYHRDPTHVVFYSPETFEWIARNLGFSLLECRSNVALLRKR